VKYHRYGRGFLKKNEILLRGDDVRPGRGEVAAAGVVGGGGGAVDAA
jgi:hypothetical protein